MAKGLLLPAGLTGLAAALLLSLIQAIWVTPLILEAERYEVHAEHEASRQDQAWQPENVWQRTAATAGANLLLAFGLALMLSAAYRLKPPSATFGGALWGLAGYAAFFAAPAVGLPPELPGNEAADLTARQVWWVATVVGTASGLALLCWSPHRIAGPVGWLLIVLPHAIGAPEIAAVQAGSAPDGLQTRFVTAAALTNLAFWLLLGSLSAALFRASAVDEGGRPNG
ncbi:CbtA family protein [Methylomonas rhizoryzae]|uniref:CbtA family protein n=1 Tax=Methylomonas rhizoryzae TaxID=2608981 RepID=UPI0012329F1A|nr:CbtA family protein [Methylomonas rhizoryzae]